MATPTARQQRADMVQRTIAERGVDDPKVLAAMRSVPRERFIADRQSAAAYEDHPLPIGSGQTISQPYVVALMAEAASIEPTDRVLEVGTGSGYGAAVLSCIAGAVVTIERHGSLARRAAKALDGLHMDNVEVVVGDGTLGWPAGAPYDAIVVTAAAPIVPPALVEQLADGGRLVMPVGRSAGAQELLCFQRLGDRLERSELGGVTFVPLISDQEED